MGFTSLLEDIEKHIERLSHEATQRYTPSEVAVAAQKKRLEKEQSDLANMVAEIRNIYDKAHTSILKPTQDHASIIASTEILNDEHRRVKTEIKRLKASLRKLSREENSAQSKLQELNAKLKRFSLWEAYAAKTGESIENKDKDTFLEFVNIGMRSFIENHPDIIKARKESKQYQNNLTKALNKKNIEIEHVKAQLDREKKITTQLRKQVSKEKSRSTLALNPMKKS